MTINKRKWKFDLQRFAEGDLGGAPAMGSSTGVSTADAGQNATIGQTGQDAAVSTKATFDEILKDAEYKKAYDERVNKAVMGRLKNAEADKARLASIERLLEPLGAKYGIRPGEDGKYDIEAMQKAVDSDDSYYEAEAMEKNMAVSDVKHIKALERDNAEYVRREKEAKQRESERAMYNTLVAGAEETKKIYPNFDLDTEMQNQTFARMVMGAGVPVRTAFEVVHKDEIIPAAMQYTAKVTAEQAAHNIAAGNARPIEGGAGAGNAIDSGFNPSSLTKEQWRQIVEDAKKGKKTSF